MDEFENSEIGQFVESILSLTDIEEEELTDGIMEQLKANIEDHFSSPLMLQSMNRIVKNLEDQALSLVGKDIYTTNLQ